MLIKILQGIRKKARAIGIKMEKKITTGSLKNKNRVKLEDMEDFLETLSQTE